MKTFHTLCISRCKINVPRNARIDASRVVEYVPQYDEVVKPKLAESSTHLWPIEAAAMSAAEDDVVSLCDDSCQASDEGEIDQVPVKTGSSGNGTSCAREILLAPSTQYHVSGHHLRR